MRNHSESHRRFICVTGVPELNVIQEDDNGYTFGSAVTFDTMEETFKKCIEELPGELHFMFNYNQVLIERFSIECRKTKTNQSNDSGQSEQRKIQQGTNENSKLIHVTGLKRGKTRVTKSRLVLVLNLIGSKGGASFLDKSQSVIKQNQCNPGLLSGHSIENCCITRALIVLYQLSWKMADQFLIISSWWPKLRF